MITALCTRSLPRSVPALRFAPRVRWGAVWLWALLGLVAAWLAVMP